MIIGISGKIGSGKDTIGEIVNFLIYQNYFKEDENIQKLKYIPKCSIPYTPDKFHTKKFADTLKDIVCLLIGCTREQLEDHEFKNTELGEEWTRYSYATGFTEDNKGNKTMLSTQCSKEKYEYERRINWQTAYKLEYTPRLLLQHIGTNLFRDQLHANVHVNSLFSKYKIENLQGLKEEFYQKNGHRDFNELKLINKSLYQKLKIEFFEETNKLLPNWIITDLRFPNELEAIKERQGISIRVNRTYSKEPIYIQGEELSGTSRHDWEQARPQHESETALDSATFDEIIDNNEGIPELVEKVREILIRRKIIN